VSEEFLKEDLEILKKRMKELKMRELFHEPCYWEDEEDEQNYC
tara:strand:+ start:1189 stop:1317 length:129 start_codon:yes stop_codon:yes gene_type:complete